MMDITANILLLLLIKKYLLMLTNQSFALQVVGKRMNTSAKTAHSKTLREQVIYQEQIICE